ncbi:hypothetical protein [Desulfovibrio ferrophilus]|uniref:Uncharacterized protein n=1 Tax=Desulfovibrio ferrophilus TaxID=241368 RepID=A0A2Z6B1I8_9BACT|nr:hypothetical protein [Desulfovibrio ferrophilus]BBD09352.1 uncharacterized protein DFE_2626 [Desulfovibrio ferrophilus]
MRPRELHNCPGLIASNYKVSRVSAGSFQHEFTPKTTGTIYVVYTSSSAPVVVVGHSYNVGYVPQDNGKRLVDQNDIVEITDVDQLERVTLFEASLAEMGKIFDREKYKNDDRVKPHVHGGEYYWGKKYAWRVFGLLLGKGAFHAYLKEVGHPHIDCVVDNPDDRYPAGPSFAYLENGLEDAIRSLIVTAVKEGQYYKSPLYSKRFTIKPLGSLSDKK